MYTICTLLTCACVLFSFIIHVFFSFSFHFSSFPPSLLPFASLSLPLLCSRAVILNCHLHKKDPKKLPELQKLFVFALESHVRQRHRLTPYYSGCCFQYYFRLVSIPIKRSRCYSTCHSVGWAIWTWTLSELSSTASNFTFQIC